MNDEEIPVGRIISNIIAVLALALLLSLAGLVVLGAVGGDAAVRGTLTHVIEIVIGVFVGIAAGRLTSGDQ